MTVSALHRKVTMPPKTSRVRLEPSFVAEDMEVNTRSVDKIVRRCYRCSIEQQSTRMCGWHDRR